MAGSFRILAHTADTGIAVTADTLSELFEWAARGMFELMYDTRSPTPQQELDIAVEATSVDELLVDLLSELLYRCETADVMPCSFTAGEAEPTLVRMTVGVAPNDPTLLHGPPIKAVTYHDLLVAPSPDGGWAARVIFDV
jgi:SHS2 domain-containing protein